MSNPCFRDLFICWQLALIAPLRHTFTVKTQPGTRSPDPERPEDFPFYLDAWPHFQVVAIGCENGSLQLLDTRTGAIEHSIANAHSARIRGVAAVPALSPSDAAGCSFLGTASSDGAVKLWDLRSTGGPPCFAGHLFFSPASPMLLFLAGY